MEIFRNENGTLNLTLTDTELNTIIATLGMTTDTDVAGFAERNHVVVLDDKSTFILYDNLSTFIGI